MCKNRIIKIQTYASIVFIGGIIFCSPINAMLSGLFGKEEQSGSSTVQKSQVDDANAKSNWWDSVAAGVKVALPGSYGSVELNVKKEATNSGNKVPNIPNDIGPRTASTVKFASGAVSFAYAAGEACKIFQKCQNCCPEQCCPK